MIKLVIFDLDDTLYDEFQFVESGFRGVAAYLSEKYKVSAKKLHTDMISYLKLHGRGKVFNLLCEKYKFHDDIIKLVQIYRNSKGKFKLYDDSNEILEKLKYNYKLGMITDGNSDAQWNKIKCLGVEKYFDKIIVTDDFGREYWKPSEYAYKKILEYFDYTPREAVYIGDNPIKDFIGARKVGITTVRIIREHGDNMNLIAEKGYDADYTIRNLNEILDIL